MTPKARLFFGASTLALVIDVVTKIWVDTHMRFTDRVEVIDGFFYLTHVRNRGAAFGLLSDAPEVVRFFLFVGVTIVALGLIVSFYRRLAPGDRLAALALGLILGGALGNLGDRIFRDGEVVDFLHFILWGGYVWPDFNFADTWIVTGVGLLVIELLASEGETREDPAGVETDS